MYISCISHSPVAPAPPVPSAGSLVRVGRVEALAELGGANLREAQADRGDDLLAERLLVDMGLAMGTMKGRYGCMMYV